MNLYDTTQAFLLLMIIMAVRASPTGHPTKPEIPGRSQYSGRMYFAIAATGSGQIYSRAFNKTLANITQSYLTGKANVVTYNISIETLVIELPETGSFSSKFLQNVCERFEGKHVVAVLVVGNSRAAFTVALAAGHAGVPVLWARGTNSFLPGFNNLDLSPFEVYLEPTSRELMEALRALFIQTHWHSFTILADDSVISSVLLRRELVAILEAPPLNPTLVQLPALHQPQALFRRLADVSRSTRGVVILMCDRASAGRVLDEARRLNMVDSHFVWLWIDTEPLNFTTTQPTVADKPEEQKRDKRAPTPLNRTDTPPETSNKRNVPSVTTAGFHRAKRNPVQVLESHRAFVKSDINDMHAHYLIKNDQFLLFNRQPIVETSKYRDSVISAVKKKTWTRYDRKRKESWPELPAGLLSIRALPMKVDRHLVKGAVRLLVGTLRTVLARCPDWLAQSIALEDLTTSCWTPVSASEFNFSTVFSRELKTQCSDALAGKKLLQENGAEKVDKSLVSNFEVSNLVPDTGSKETDNEMPETSSQGAKLKWRTVGHVTGRTVHLDTIVWPGGGIVVAGLSSQARSVFRVVTALAPPFVMESGLDEDGQCLRGLPCHRVLTSDKDNLTLVFNEMDTQERMGDEIEENKRENEDEKFLPFQRYKFKTNCCYGLAMDLLENIAHELEFDFRLYIVADGVFGTKVTGNRKRLKRDVGKAYLNYKFKQDGIFKGQRIPGAPSEAVQDDLGDDCKWNGIVGDLVSGAAHMSFAALSVSSPRSEVIDYSAPYFFSGVSFLAAPQQKSEIPLMAFLLPFSPELWIAIFTSLNVTAIAVAIYEWLSPFGLNPWGRQRSKNFSMSSALWVMWGLLCGHLVAFKAPKSWPNKFLINVWGGFSVIFVASYTANIAALIAGLFFQNTVSNYHDRSLLSQKVGTPQASAAEYYVKRASKLLWDHMHRFTLDSVEDGIERLRNGSLDILIADTPILDYYRATDHGCTLQKIGDSINEDTYAVGMTKGFPLKDSISAVISKYASNGYMDILQEKWYGGLPCFKLVTEIAQPRPLGVTAVTGVFILLGVGVILGVLILIFEHLFYRYTLPILRHKPKGTIWRSRNIMFFSQKLYRFINCVELVSPHHAARELVHTLRQGQITSLFQKSVKRKEHEQRRRRKSKAQFFEMIQEIRRQQQESRQQPPLASLTEVDQEYQLSPDDKKGILSPNIIRRTFMRSSPKLETHSKIKSPPNIFGSSLFSPRSKNRARSQTALNVRRFSTDSVFNSQTLKIDRSSAIGRRLSKDAGFLSSSPPDINSRRSSYLDIINSSGKLSGKSPVLSIENVSECESVGRKPNDFHRKISDAESIGRKLATLPKYKDNLNANRLHPGDCFNQGKSEETLPKPETNNPNYGTLQVNEILSAQSFQNTSDSTKHEVQVNPDLAPNISDDEIAKRNKVTIDQLKVQFKKTDTGKPLVTRSQSNAANPSIRIQVEDTSKPKLPDRKLKSRHRSLGETPQEPPEPTKRVKLIEQSKSLDVNPILPVREASRNMSKNRGYETDHSINCKEVPRNRSKTRDYDSDQCRSEKPQLPPKDGLRMKLRKREELERPKLPTKDNLRNKGRSRDALDKDGSTERQQLLSKEPIRSTEERLPRSTEGRVPGKDAFRSTEERIPGNVTGKSTERQQLLGKEPPKSIEGLPRKEASRYADGHQTIRGKSKCREPSKSLDENPTLPIRDTSRSRSSKCREHDLPPAPPPPNCSPRNSNGRSPLERLSKDELVNLWRSSESELRSHLLKALRDKGSDDPP